MVTSVMMYREQYKAFLDLFVYVSGQGGKKGMEEK